MREVTRELAPALPEDLRELLSFDAEPGAVAALAARLDRWLSLPEGERRAAGQALSARAASLWSWEGVAEGVIAASRGTLDGLAPVPAD